MNFIDEDMFVTHRLCGAKNEYNSIFVLFLGRSRNSKCNLILIVYFFLEQKEMKNINLIFFINIPKIQC